MQRPRIPVSGPWITQKEIDCVTDAVTNAWYEKHNIYQAQFEAAFAGHLGARFAIALPSCTSAIHLSLLALDIGAGDEVIVPDITWIASSAPITYVGATPVFADIDPHTWCLSAASLDACITPRTKAVMPVDLYGGMPDWDAILEVARRRRIAVIEDAAEAVGSEYRGKKAGSFGDAGVFSFHGSKTLTTGEGGMLVTDRADIHQRAQVLRDHGRPPGDKSFFNAEVAHKYKMSSLQAALGLAQLRRIDELVGRKREIFGWYQAALHGTAGIALNAEPAGTKNSYWMNTIVTDPASGLEKEKIIERMSLAGIDCRPFFHPLSALPAYREFGEAGKARQRNAVSYRLSPHGVNLPSGLNLTKETVTYVTDNLKGILAS